MATFVYAPAIRVHIGSQKSGIIDISDDVTQWQLTRRSSTVSSFNFVLQNTQRKYDGMFRPSDRVTVWLKRITWVQVFTGSLNSAPIFSAWPRAIPLSASCTLKKLQFWPWDPTTQAAVDMTQTTMNSLKTDDASGDGGLSRLIVTSLDKVTGWDPKQIHIGSVPNAWFNWARKIEKGIDAASSMANVLGATAVINGVSVGGSIIIPEGNYGGLNMNAEMLSNAAQVYGTILAKSGLTTAADQDLAAKIAFMVIATESSPKFIENADMLDHDSIGLYQQRPNWGSAAERIDPIQSTLLFLGVGPKGRPAGLLQQPNWRIGSPQIAAQNTQGSAFSDGSNYGRWEKLGTELAAAARAAFNASLQNRAVTGSGTNLGIPTSQGSFVAAGPMLAKVAVDLIAQRRSHPILYDETESASHAPGVYKSDAASITSLDCSAFVDWCYYHATGSEDMGTAASAAQYAMCSVYPPIEIAAHIQGALLFAGPAGRDHVGISIGDGTSAAAHQIYPDPVKDVSVENIAGDTYTSAGLLKKIDYSAAATNAEALAWIRINLKLPGAALSTTPLSQITNPGLTGPNGTVQPVTNDPFAALVQAIAIAPQASGNIFGGPRELMNNQPFLPWIKNLTNSSMREFCSAPNGDFIAWFPDYFNVWKTAAIMKIQPIELQDFTAEWSDQQIVTHEFVLGSTPAQLDGYSGGIVNGATQDYSQLSAMLATNGIATMDFPQIFEAIYNKTASHKFTTDYLTRFGARPNLEQMPNINHGPQEFYMALWNFMKYWAAQFNATVPMTFMPELYPGMLIQIPEYDFQAYVTEVTHSGSYGQNGQFTTQATIVAPAPIDPKKRSTLFGMLDI